MRDATTPDVTWWKRYTTTAVRLDHTAAMVAVQRLVASVDLGGPPGAVVVSGAARVQRSRRVGLFAGSFNPLTLAHVALARAAQPEAMLDLVIWAFAAVTVDKERVERASLPDRLAQMTAYVRSRRGNALVVLNRGLYVDEARAVRALLSPDAELSILVGFDKIVQIFNPHYYDDRDAALDALFAQARLLVAPRDGAGRAELDALLAKPENRRYAEHLTLVPLPPEYARDSSTEARQRATMGAQPDALADLLPPEGAALATKTGAYLTTITPSVLDTYTLRQAWLYALQGESSRILMRLPELSTLVDLARHTGESSLALRAFLAAPERAQQDVTALVARASASTDLHL